MKKKVIIIGAGVSGLTAGIYACKMGFEVEIYESHSVPGGMCTGWKRKGYAIDGCIHWLTGSKKGSDLYHIWETCGALADDIKTIHQDYISSIWYEGRYYYVYSDLEKLEKEFLSISPEDELLIKELVKFVRISQNLPIPACKPQELLNLFDKIKFYIPYIKAGKDFAQMTKCNIEEYIGRFQSPVIRRLLSTVIPNTNLTANVLFFTLATFSLQDGGWPVGGSVAMVQRMVKKFISSGGKINLKTPVNKIFVRNGTAVGVELFDKKRAEC